MKRDFVRIADLSVHEIGALFELTATLKRAPKASQRHRLAGRGVAIVLEKASTRTRVSFEIGVAQLGGHPVVLGEQGSQIGRGEPIRDTARVLSRYCDLIAFRTFGTPRLHEMCAASVPVINALSDDGHPVQVLSDLFTLEEQFGGGLAGLRARTIAWIGDGSSNMARSWVEAARVLDFKLIVAAPEGYRPPREEVVAAGDRVTIVSDPREAVRHADVVNTDVWTSMGQELENAARLKAFTGWSVDSDLMSHSPAHAVVLHCLPAHRGEEIDDATIEGPRSRVWDQAENRLHVQKALMCFLLGV
ncbi:MAG: ornithine carbamoyltransferase [Polyangiales bacterium]